MIIAVVEKDYNRAEGFQERYIGAPCQSFEEATELIFAHFTSKYNNVTNYFVENGMRCVETNRYTGEVVREYFMMLMAE